MSKDKLTPELRFPEFDKDGKWDIKTFKELFEIGNGRDYKHLDEGDIPVYGSGGYMLSVNDYLYDGESACIGRKGTINNPMFLSGKFWTVDTLFYTHSFKDCLPKYVYYLFQSIDWLKHNEAGGVPSLSKTNIYQIETLISHPQEQQKIAACLSSLDELIAAHNDKLDALKDHKKGLMQNLFPQEGETVPKVRFSEFEGDGDWLPTTVEDNCLVKGRIGYRGYTKQDLVKEGEGVLVLGGKHIQNQLLNISDPTFLSWEKYYESPEIMVEVNHIIFSQRGTLGDCAIIDRALGPATINPSMVLIKNITCVARFLYYILIGDCIQEEVRKNRSNGAIPMLSQKQIKGFSFLIPKPQEQQKIASCLSALDKLIIAQTEKIEQLQQHKKGLMQGLFPKIEM
ncbi:MAG: type I restriction enzyme S subunit [Cyclobacteriaceae bacterium]|jgi:type I restriction enzyme S subunit